MNHKSNVLSVLLGCLALTTVLNTSNAARAVDYFWTNSNGGAFDEPSHWTPYSPPVTQGPGGANDTVNFDLGVSSITPYFVTDMGRENSQLIVHNDSLLLSVFVHHELSSTGGANPSFIVGASSGDDGFVSLSGGGVSILDTQVVRIANVAGSEGSVGIYGLEWNSDNFRVGHAGDGILSTDFDAVINSTNASIAHLTGSTGRAVILGNWDIGDTFIVGRQGDGDLEVTSGGMVTSNTSIVGDRLTGDGDVVVNATWITSGSLTVGNSGRGELLVTTTLGNVSSGDAYVGRLPGSNGGVVVGNGAWTTNGRLSIGGDVNAAASGGSGLVEITGGTVAATQDITVFPDGQISLVGGSLDAPIIEFQAGASFDWAGGLLTVDTFYGSLPNNGGVLAARSGSNSILITGEYSQAPLGELSITIDGPAVSHQYDSMVVGNTAFLGGILHVELADGFLPDPSETYTILDALNIGAGSFSNVANGERLFLDLSGGSFLVNYGAESSYDPSQVVLSDFLRPADADFDDDGHVDGDDLLVWQGAYGAGAGADADGDGDSDGRDFLQWQRQFGAPPLAAIQTLNVPEPGCVALFIAGILAGCCQGRIVDSDR